MESIRKILEERRNYLLQLKKIKEKELLHPMGIYAFVIQGTEHSIITG